MDPISNTSSNSVELAQSKALQPEPTTGASQNQCLTASDTVETLVSAPRAPMCSPKDDPFYRPPTGDTPSLDALRAHARGEVELCKRDADILGAHVLHLKHHWLRTASKEAGMGPDDGTVPGKHLDLPYVTKTTVNDHAGRGARPESKCEEVPNVDADCVNRELEIGRKLGRWTPTNQCQSFAADVIEHCTKPKPQ